MKLKLAALAAMMAVSAPSFALIEGATSGNGSLLLNFITPGATSTNGMSAAFDLGVNLNDVLAWNGIAGFTQTWSLTAANYGSAWNDLLGFSSSDNDADIQFNVIALDNTNKTTVNNGSRYLTTADVAKYPSLNNGNLSAFDQMDLYVNANNSLGTHPTEANGASTALPGDGNNGNAYFRGINGVQQGDNWLTRTSADTTKNLTTAQNFWFLETTLPGGTAQASKTAFGFDIDGDGLIEMDNNGAVTGGFSEFSEWSVNMADGTITFATPVPEAETYAMMLAGLGLIGFLGRRRMNRSA